MRWSIVIATDDPETIYNGLRFANVALSKEDEVTVFMLGRGVEFRERSTETFDVVSQADGFTDSGGELLV